MTLINKAIKDIKDAFNAMLDSLKLLILENEFKQKESKEAKAYRLIMSDIEELEERK